MSNCEIEELRRKQEREVALKCADRVAQRYQGKPCMRTAIHSCLSQEGTPFENMFFDKLCMEKAFTSSESKLSACAGSALCTKLTFSKNTIIQGVPKKGIDKKLSVVAAHECFKKT